MATTSRRNLLEEKADLVMPRKGPSSMLKNRKNKKKRKESKKSRKRKHVRHRRTCKIYNFTSTASRHSSIDTIHECLGRMRRTSSSISNACRSNIPSQTSRKISMPPRTTKRSKRRRRTRERGFIGRPSRTNCNPPTWAWLAATPITRNISQVRGIYERTERACYPTVRGGGTQNTSWSSGSTKPRPLTKPVCCSHEQESPGTRRSSFL
ncbi:hypothetical protein F4803DRAFT_534545 [Xylaria telfairii]|nr:hypothetical protein F4803DRAFT_534545 [Xylaria telfairii]